MKRSLMALAFLVGAAGLTLAVQPPQGGRGGRGGFGGGGVTTLVTSKTVLADINATEEQTAKLKDWAKGFATKTQDMRKAAMEGVDTSDRKAMMEKFTAVQAEITKTANTELATVLKPEQVTRIKQIETQVAGVQAFNMPAVKEALKIDDEQAQKIQEAARSTAGEMRDLAQEYGVRGFGGPTDPEKAKEFAQKRAAITKQTMEKVMGTMTADQKAAYEKLVGKPIDVAKVQSETAGGGQRRPSKDNN
jgi:hypothetical protein